MITEDEGIAYITYDGGKTLNLLPSLLGLDYDVKCAVLAPDTFMLSAIPSYKKYSSLTSQSDDYCIYYLSYDGGLTWTQGELEFRVNPQRLKVKHNPDVIIIHGRDLDLIPPVSVYFSTDKGLTWQEKRFLKGLSIRASDITPSGNVMAYEAEKYYQLLQAQPGDSLLTLWGPNTIKSHIGTVEFAGSAGYLTVLNDYYNTDSYSSTIYKSVDGGLNWDSIYSVSSYCELLSFSNEYTGILATYGKKIYFTNTGGSQWEMRQQLNQSINSLKLFPGGLSCVGCGTVMYVSDDYCNSVVEIPLPPNLFAWAFNFPEPYKIIAYGKDPSTGEGRIDVSVDGGQTWSSHFLGLGKISKLQMFDENIGYATTDSGFYFIYLENNYFQQISTPGPVHNFVFSSLSEGYIFVSISSTNLDNPRMIYSTSNGGSMWTFHGTYCFLYDALAFYGTNGMAFGDHGRLLSLEMGYPLSIPEIERSINVWVNPNPTRDYVHLKLANNGLTRLTISDMTGRVVMQRLLDESLVFLDLRTLQAGVYILQAMGANEGRVRFIKSK